MNKVFLHIYDFLSSRRRLAIVLLLATMAVLLASLLRIHYSEDISHFLPKTEASQRYTDIYNHLGGQDRIAIIFDGEEDSVLSAMDDFVEQWGEVDTTHIIAELQAEMDEGEVLEAIDFVYDNIPYLLTDEDYDRMRTMLGEDDIVSKRLDWYKERAFTSINSAMIGNLSADPLGICEPVIARLRTLNISNQYKLIDGHVFTRDGKYGLLFFDSPFGISESHDNKHLQTMIDETARRVKEELPCVSISSVGAPLIAVTNASQIKRDSLLAVSIALVAILCILLYCFRRWSYLGWIALSLLYGFIFALGIIAFYRNVLSVIVIGIGSVIIGIAANYPLHFLDHLQRNPDRRRTLKEMLPPLLIGNITTVAAFLCLVPLKAVAMRDLGIFGALTLVGTILFVLIFLPVLVKGHTSNDKARALPLPTLHCNLPRGLVLGAFLLLTLILGYLSLGTSFDSDMQHINYMTRQQRQDLQLLSENTDSSASLCTVYVVEKAADMEMALQENEQLLDKLQPQLTTDKTLSSLSKFVPSKMEQQRRLQRWKEFWEEHRNLTEEISPMAEAKGFRAGVFDSFVESTQRDYEAQDADFFSPLIALTRGIFLISEDKGVTLVNYVHANPQKVEQIRTLVGDSPQQYAFTTEDVTGQLVTTLSHDFNYIGFACGFVVFFFLWFSFGRLELSLLSFLPLAVGWLWILGTMQLLDIRFNIVNIILATFIFGQGDDYTIFITEGLMYEYAYGRRRLKAYKQSVLLSAVIMFVGIGALIVARHPAMRSLAEVTLIGMATVVLMAFYLPPLVFRWLTTKKGRLRDVPLTLRQILRSLVAWGGYILGVLLIVPVMKAWFAFGGVTEKKRLKLHRIIQSFSGLIMQYLPGTTFTLKNDSGEDFSQPAIIVANHQSMLDLTAVMQLTPRLIILTKDWVWRNPLFGCIVRLAEYYPVFDGIEGKEEKFRSLIRRGYSIMIFPEGTRSPNGEIQRFHKGACYLARQLGLDIVPLHLHGFSHVLPKGEVILRPGQLYMEVGQRISLESPEWEGTVRTQTSALRKLYIERQATLRFEREDAQYVAPYIRMKYIYKGKEVESNSRKAISACLQQEEQFCLPPETRSITLFNCGQGEKGWMMALTHPNVDVHAIDADEDNISLAKSCANLPQNLHFHTQAEWETKRIDS